MRIFVFLALAALAAGCAQTARTRTTTTTARNVQPGAYPSAHASAPRPTNYRAPTPAVRPVVRAATRPAPRPTPVVRPAYRAPAYTPPAPARPPAGARLVRLRGSEEIHLANCARVLRAHPAGVQTARIHDGPPCYTCRRSEAVAGTSARATRPVTVRTPVVRAPAPVAAPRSAGPLRYVRLRGTHVVHISSCDRVRRAHRDGVLSAKVTDGPACYYCRKSEAVVKRQ